MSTRTQQPQQWTPLTQNGFARNPIWVWDAVTGSTQPKIEFHGVSGYTREATQGGLGWRGGTSENTNYIQVSTVNPTLTVPFTLFAIARLNGAAGTGYDGVVHNQGSSTTTATKVQISLWGAAGADQGKPYFSFYDTGGTQKYTAMSAQTVLSSTSFDVLVGVHDGTNIIIYQNGKAVSSAATAGAYPGQRVEPWRIGCPFGTTTGAPVTVLSAGLLFGARSAPEVADFTGRYWGRLYGPTRRIWVQLGAATGGAPDVTVSPAQGTIEATGLAPVASVSSSGVTASPDVGTALVAGLVPTVLVHRIAQPGVGAVVASGAAPSVLTNRIAQPAAGAVVTSGAAPSLLTPKTVQPAVGAAIVTGLVPTIQVGQSRVIAVPAGVIATSSFPPTVTRTNNQIVAPGAGALIAAGLAPTVQAGAIQFMRPITDVATNGWLSSLGGALVDALDEPTYNDADYIYSPNNPTTEEFEILFSAAGDPQIGTGHELSLRLQAIGQDTIFDFDLVQGTTILDSWSVGVAVADGVVPVSRTFSNVVADQITNYADVRLRGVAHG